MVKKEVTINLTELTITGGKKKNIRINVDGRNVHIPVDDTVYAYFNGQFIRTNPTQKQKQRFATITNVMRSAYLKGIADGKKMVKAG